MTRVKIAELKNNLSRYLRAVESGEEIEVTDRDRPIARIVPVGAAPPSVLIAPKRPLSEIRSKRYPPANLPVDIVQILRQERGDR